jgi:hypothetical protein
MTMLRLTGRQRAVLADKLADGGNLALGALLFGQFVAERDFSLPVAAAGLLGWLALLGITMFVARR